MRCVSQHMILVVIALLAVPPAGAQAYKVTDLGVLGGTQSFGQSVSNLGAVAGTATTTDDIFQHAFKWTSKAGMKDIGTLGGDSSTGTAINDLGAVVGSSQTTDDVETHAFVFTTKFTDLGTLIGTPTPGAFATANSINIFGQVVGASSTAEGDVHAFYWDKKHGVKDLGTLPGGSNSEAAFITALGVAVGDGDTATGETDAAYWDAKAVHDIGNLGGGSAQGLGGDVLGDIVGGSTDTAGETHAFIWNTKQGMVDLGTLGGTFSTANAIQVADDCIPGTGNAVAVCVVGTATTVGDADTHAFMWNSKNGMVDLNSQISATSGWDLQSANSINLVGQITGTGLLNGETHAFLLTPTN